MQELLKKEMDTLDMVEKRLEILLAAKLREKDKIKNAIMIQDRLRNKSKNWNGVKEIRKWRDGR
ncbi:MAG: hypothetical protein ACE5J9_04690 [Methanosarcinales archaeon]